jgi:16S rRNA (cytidine1402-2'-O)-methyltransferase
VLGLLRKGARVALVSDAGLPGVNDPGTRLVAAALDAGISVTVLPGPSAVASALVASGLASERYQFLGFLPRTEKARDSLWGELARWPYTAVAFESPKRLPASLASLARALPERRVAVCRELTKRFEEVVVGRADELAARFQKPPKGEIAIVLGAQELRPRVELEDAVSSVAELVAEGVPRRRASDLVAALTGLPRNELYRRSL